MAWTWEITRGLSYTVTTKIVLFVLVTKDNQLYTAQPDLFYVHLILLH
jgi:hypothetical protein